MWNRTDVYSTKIKTYEEALAHEASVKPIRGKTIKPLHRRRDTHLTIRKQDVWQAALLEQTETVFEGEEVVIKLYETDIVKYRPNGDIYVNIDGWVSMTTCQVLTDILGADFHKYYNRMWVRCDIPESYTPHALPIDAHAPNIFRVNMSNTLEFQNYKYPVVHTLSRQAANIVRKQYKSFRQYLTNNFKLRSDNGVTCTFGVEEFAHAFEIDDVYGMPRLPNVQVVGNKWTSPKAIAHYMALITNDGLGHKTEDFYKAVLTTVGGNRHAVTLKQLLKVLDDCILYHHRDTVFVEKQVTTGAWAKDNYLRFVE
jgi:hypothetical protein